MLGGKRLPRCIWPTDASWGRMIASVRDDNAAPVPIAGICTKTLEIGLQDSDLSPDHSVVVSSTR